MSIGVKIAKNNIFVPLFKSEILVNWYERATERNFTNKIRKMILVLAAPIDSVPAIFHIKTG